MTNEQKNYLSKLRNKLLKNYEQKELVELGAWTEKIGRTSKVRLKHSDVNKYTNEYTEVSVNNIGKDGDITLLTGKVLGEANVKALESQRLHKGDLLFGFRSKIEKIGLVKEEYDLPVVGNHGTMRIVLSPDRKMDTPLYVRSYLNSPLIKSYLNSMMVEKSGVLVLEPDVLKGLPIPKFIEIGEDTSTFSVMFNLALEMSEWAKKLEEASRDAFYLQYRDSNENSPIFSVYHNLKDNFNSWEINRKMHMGKDSKNVLNEQFTDEEND